MQIITSREFRANQRKYFALAEKEPVFVMRRGAKPVSISVVNDSDMMSASDLESIRRGLEDVKTGNTHTLGANESLDALLDRV